MRKQVIDITKEEAEYAKQLEGLLREIIDEARKLADDIKREHVDERDAAKDEQLSEEALKDLRYTGAHAEGAAKLLKDHAKDVSVLARKFDREARQFSKGIEQIFRDRERAAKKAEREKERAARAEEKARKVEKRQAERRATEDNS